MIGFILGYLLASGDKQDNKSYIGPNTFVDASVLSAETIMEYRKISPTKPEGGRV